MTKEQVLEFIAQHIDAMTYKDIAQELGMTTEQIRGRARRAGITKKGRVYNRTQVSYNKELKTLGSSFTLLEPFTRVSDPLKHQCNSCGIVELRRPQDILLSPKCSKCSRKPTKVIEPLDSMLTSLPTQYKYLSGYQGLSKKCKFICMYCDNVWEAVPSKLIHSASGCPKCKSINTSLRCRTPIEEVRERSLALGLEFMDTEYLGNKYEHTFKNLACGHTFKYKFNYIKQDTCRYCAEVLRTSTPERELNEYIHSLGFKTHKGKLSDGKEIDIIVEGTDIGIEFNGSYWHSEKAGKASSYHLNKTKLFDGKLVHIYAFMWDTKKLLLKSMLAHMLGKTSNRIYARTCEIKEVVAKDARVFLDTNHIQGFLSASKYLALMHNDTIVAMMTFNKSRFSSKYEYEIGRYAVAMNTCVTGGASKLFKYFTKLYTPESIVSYCHRFYSNGGVYAALGMELVGESRPGYWYLHPDGKTVSSRQKFQKHKLGGLLPNFDASLTELQNMENNGYSRIHDCGNLVFSWNK